MLVERFLCIGIVESTKTLLFLWLCGDDTCTQIKYALLCFVNGDLSE